MGGELRKQIYHLGYLLRYLDKSYSFDCTEKVESILGERVFDETYRRMYPFDISFMKKYANNILQHKLDLFELKNIFLGDRIEWNRDYKTGNYWPQKFAFSIDWRNTDVGGVKYVWEINRHQYIVALAKSYYITQDEKYGAECLNLLWDWVETNRALEGINWRSPLELSIRVISWTFVLHLLWDMLDFADVRLGKIVSSLFAQTLFIEKNLSRYSSANNHRLGEVAGLAVVGLGFTGFREASRWTEKGLSFLEEEILAQIHSDGVGKEQSIGYLCFILDLALVAFAFARFRGRVLSEEVWHRIEKACEFIIASGEHPGALPRIGDDDDGFGIRFDDSSDNMSAVVGTVGAMRTRNDFLAWSSPLPEKVFWLTGVNVMKREKYIRSFNKEREDLTNSVAFENGGYYMMRSQVNGKVISGQIDSGELGYLSIAAHGHADCLSFILRHGSEFLLVDPGTYLYQSGGPWRDYFKSTRAHNTITVDGKNQSVSAGTFLWHKKAQPDTELWSTTEEIDIVIGSHDGYTRLNSPVVHRRAIIFLKPSIFLLVDKLLTSGTHEYEQNYHLHPDASAQRISDHHWILRGKDTHCCLLLSPFENQRVSAVQAEDNPILGWYSPAFGTKQPTTTIHNTFTNKGDCISITILGMKREDLFWNYREFLGTIGLECRANKRSYLIQLSNDLITPIRCNKAPLHSDYLGVIMSSENTLFRISRKFGLRPVDTTQFRLARTNINNFSPELL
jgi:hypothetical protein